MPVHSRPGPRLGGIGLSGAIPFVSSTGARVLSEAILYRVFAEVPVMARPECYLRAIHLRSGFFSGFLSESEPMDLWDWIKSMPSRRRKALVRAQRLREERGEDSTRYCRITPFVKTEHLPYFRQHGGGYTHEGVTYVARLIQAPHDETHLDAGPWLKPLVAKLKEDWSSSNWLFYASVAPEKLDAWLNRNASAVSWFWSDYSSFDATHTALSWDMIEGFYSVIYPHADPQFWKALNAWRVPHGKARCRKDEVEVEYHAPVCNASGRDDTALANALLNGIVLACSFASVLSGVPVHQLEERHLRIASGKVNIAVVGDDSLVACSFDVRPMCGELERRISDFGLVAKAEVGDLLDTTFLGMMPYPVRGRYYWGPTMGRRLYKAFWQADPVGNLPAWTLGVAKQLSLYKCVPVLNEIASRVIALLPGGKVTTLPHEENRVWAARTAATPDYDSSTVRWVCERYRRSGLTERAVLADLETIRGITRLPALVRLFTTDAALAEDGL